MDEAPPYVAMMPRTFAASERPTTPSASSERLVAAFEAALGAAEAFIGATAPNPAVGCAILGREGELLAVAAHERAGSLHAEAAALRKLKDGGLIARARTAVVTLEPCSHQGRTPPCSRALIESPIEEIWIGALDPHPRAPGRGVADLKAAGRRVLRFEDVGSHEGRALAARAERLIRPFSVWSRTGRPFVRIKTALTAEGEMIPPAGRKTFTSEESLLRAHELRREADAILTGSGCVLADDPEFTVRRVPDHHGRRRLLAILDRRRRVPESYFEAARGRGLDPVRYDALEDALDDLGARGVLSVLVEAGPTLRRSILATNLWDEEIVFQKDGDPTRPDRVRILERAPVEPTADVRVSAVPEEL